MACFIVPLTQAIATTAYRKLSERKALAQGVHQDSFISRNLKSLEKMLWGGSLMLIVDHVINGEVTWMYPFFTALETEGGSMVMLREMLTVGVPMSLIVTATWAAYCLLKERQHAVANTK